MTRKSITVNRKKLFKAVTFRDFRHLADEPYLKLQYSLNVGEPLDLENPTTFNEKLNWLKLHDRNPLYTQLVDKYEVRKYVEEKIGAEYLIPIHGIYDNYEAIDFEALPDEFVLKANHTSGGVFIIRDKSEIDHEKLEAEVDYWMNYNYYWDHREFPYKHVKPRMMAEKLMVDESGDDLKDYKFFCFDGEPQFMYVASERDNGTKFDFYDLDFNHLPVKQKFENSNQKIEKPEAFAEMLELSRKLSADIPHVRVDLYNINGKIYFGELTFYHMAANEPFDPKEFDEKFGDFLKLPEK